MLERKERMLSFIDANGRGLEIGPSHSPIAPKAKGYNVEIIDHTTADELRKKYAAEDITAIEEVDYVWSGEKYSDLTGKKNHYDWIIASHVIEHVPDFISFINGCAEVLVEDGVLLLAVPDYRLCFDQLRMPSGMAEVVEAYHDKRVRHSYGDILDTMLNSSAMDGTSAWSLDLCGGENKLVLSFDDVISGYQECLSSDEYRDIHKWRFTPSSFKLLVGDLLRLNMISMGFKDMYGPDGCEFVVAMKKVSQASDDVANYQDERLVLLEAIQYELAEPILKKIENLKQISNQRKKKKRFFRKLSIF